jgi:hypothetical protein
VSENKPTEQERDCHALRLKGQSYKQIAYDFNLKSHNGDWTEARVRNAVQKCLSYERAKLRLEHAIDHDAKLFDNFEVDKRTGIFICIHSSHAQGSVDVYHYPGKGKDSVGILDALEALRRHNYQEHGVV